MCLPPSPRRGDAADGRPRGARGHGHRHRDRRCAGRRGLQDLRREGGAEFEQITADLLKLEEPAGATFDLTYCRLLLMQMRDPVAILEKMAAWTKPGGVVVAQEFDFGSIAVEPTCPAMGEFNRVFEGVFRGYGRNMHA